MSSPDDLTFAVQLARGAGEVVRDHYGHVDRLTKTNSASTDEAVTIADRAAQRHIVTGLKQRFPGDGLIGEESDTGETITFEVPDPAGRVWVIDPIDGTNNFIAGLGNFAVCIGLLEAGVPTLGVVYDVTRDAMYAGAAGIDAYVETPQVGRIRLRAANTGMTDSAMLMLTSNLLGKDDRCPEWACKLIAQTTWKTRILGSAAVEAVQVAAGVAHGAVTVNGKLWDAVAPAAIVRAAGGVVVGLDGGAIWPFELLNYQGAKVPYLAAAPNAVAALLDLFQRWP